MRYSKMMERCLSILFLYLIFSNYYSLHNFSIPNFSKKYIRHNFSIPHFLQKYILFNFSIHNFPQKVVSQSLFIPPYSHALYSHLTHRWKVKCIYL